MITTEDIQLLKSEKMVDTDDGGGRMSGEPVVDGVSNNMFPDISELDRAYGRVSLRKVFPAVLSNNTDTYYGANVIIDKPPSDENVRVTMLKFSDSNAWFNTRSTARSKLEAYLVLGAITPMRLVAKHYAGQRVLVVYQQLNDPLPTPGKTYVVRSSDGTKEQYVRFLKIEQRRATYIDSNGSFERLEMTITLSDALRYDFDGGVTRETQSNPVTGIYNTYSADAVSCYGIAKLTSAAGMGSMQLKVDKYKDSIVPATQSESTILDAFAGSSKTITLSNAYRTVTLSAAGYSLDYQITSENRQYNYVFQLPFPPEPGTVEIAYRSRDNWYTVTDNGSGLFQGWGSGTINYTTGSIAVTLKDLPDVNTSLIVSWGEKSNYVAVDSGGVQISPPEWRITLSPTPIKPGSVTITWLGPNNTQLTSTDTTFGRFTQNGTGKINYLTGELWFRPATLPVSTSTPQVTFQKGIDSVTDTFTNVAVSQNTFELNLSKNPQYPITITYTMSGPSVWGDPNNPDRLWRRVRYVTVGSIQLNLNEPTDIGNGVVVTVINTGGDLYRVVVQANSSLSIGMFGSIDYQNKHVSITAPAITVYYTENVEHGISYSGPSGGWSYFWHEPEDRTGILSFDNTTSATVVYSELGTGFENYQATLNNIPLTIDLLPLTNEKIVPNSIYFTLNGQNYQDVDGRIYWKFTGSSPGELAGTIDYSKGIISLTAFSAGATSFQLRSGYKTSLVKSGSEITFRMPAPVKPASTTIAAVTPEGQLLTGMASSGGSITGDYVEGYVNIETGVCKVRFGQWVDPNTVPQEERTEDWYVHPITRPSDGYYWKPRAILLDTARYNAVVYTYLPLSADILGLDPVRLPSDGKVPIFRVGDVVVVHHTSSDTLTSITQNQEVTLSRSRLAHVRVYDASGDIVPATKYTVNLDTGKITFTDTSGIVTPVTVEHRIEDMALVSDLQIDGTLTITRPLTHDFPVGSYVSTALILGDTWARVSLLFTQATWTGAWSDTLIGSDTTGKYNTAVYPIEITNKGAITERWAIIFTSATAFKLVGEHVGQIAVGDIYTDFSPINPATGAPYFTIRASGWSSGWATGNVLRLNTIGANYPIWVCRTVLQSQATSGSDTFRVCIRGDVDTE